MLQAIQEYLTLESLTGGYETAALQATAVNRFYDAAASLVNGQPRNIAFTSSSTNSFARALSSISFQRGDTIVIANEDYVSNQLAFLSLQKRAGVQLLRAASLADGGVDVTDMEQLIRKHRPRLVSLTHVPSYSGLVQPVAAIGKICRELDITYLVDVCQSAGQLPLDAEAMGCDFMCGSMRKFLRGPRGAGFLYVSDRILAQPLAPLYVDLNGAQWTAQDDYELAPDAKRFQDWEQSHALMSGSHAAIAYALRIGLDVIAERNNVLCTWLRSQLQQLPGVRLLDKGAQLCSIITLSIPDVNPQWLVKYLRDKHINTALGTNSGSLIDFADKGVDWALRISPHYYNTEEEGAELIEVLRTVLS